MRRTAEGVLVGEELVEGGPVRRIEGNRQRAGLVVADIVPGRPLQGGGELFPGGRPLQQELGERGLAELDFGDRGQHAGGHPGGAVPPGIRCDQGDLVAGFGQPPGTREPDDPASHHEHPSRVNLVMWMLHNKGDHHGCKPELTWLSGLRRRQPPVRDHRRVHQVPPAGVQGRHRLRRRPRSHQNRGQGPDQRVHPQSDLRAWSASRAPRRSTSGTATPRGSPTGRSSGEPSAARPPSASRAPPRADGRAGHRPSPSCCPPWPACSRSACATTPSSTPPPSTP